MDFSAMKISPTLGVETVDMGATAGILAGLVTAWLHNKYHKVQFPAAIAFYGGKRFVALIVIVTMSLIGLVMPLIWFIDSFSRSIWSIYFRYIRTIVDSNRTPSCIKFII